MRDHVFISHSSEDRDAAARLVEAIEGHGARAWIAPRDLRAGHDFSDQLEQAIGHCAAFVVLLSEHSNKSMFVRAEAENAFRLGKPIFPVRLSDVEPASGLGLFLRIHHWTDAFGPNERQNLDRLVNELSLHPDIGTTTKPQETSGARTDLASPPRSTPKLLLLALGGAGVAAVSIAMWWTTAPVPGKGAMSAFNDAAPAQMVNQAASNDVANEAAVETHPGQVAFGNTKPSPLLLDEKFMVGAWGYYNSKCAHYLEWQRFESDGRITNPYFRKENGFPERRWTLADDTLTETPENKDPDITFVYNVRIIDERTIRVTEQKGRVSEWHRCSGIPRK